MACTINEKLIACAWDGNNGGGGDGEWLKIYYRKIDFSNSKSVSYSFSNDT